jgi:hypothetical protein
MTERAMDEAEARRILENLARNGPPTAQVASIKVLIELDKAAEAGPEPDAFDALDTDEIAARRRRKTATPVSTKPRLVG